MKYSLIISIFFLPTFLLNAQSLDESSGRYTFITPDRNRIENDAHLQPFFERLYQLKRSGEGQVNIIHLGDSHIQADFLTNVVRKNLQREFGNAGRGLVVPARVAGTNEPLNFRSSST